MSESAFEQAEMSGNPLDFGPTDADGPHDRPDSPLSPIEPRARRPHLRSTVAAAEDIQHQRGLG